MKAFSLTMLISRADALAQFSADFNTLRELWDFIAAQSQNGATVETLFIKRNK